MSTSRRKFPLWQSPQLLVQLKKVQLVSYTYGGIIYINHRLRDNLSFNAPYIYTGTEPNMAIYGVEGYKPGSSVTSVYLSLQVLPLVRGGHWRNTRKNLDEH